MGIDHIDVALSLVGAQLVDLLLEVGIVDREQMRGKVEPLPARIVAVEAALEVAGHRREASLAVRPHADGVELERGHAEVVIELPQLGKLLDQRRDQLLGRVELGQCVCHDERLESGQRIEGHVGDQTLVELLDVHAAMVRERHGRRAKARRVGDGEIHLVLRGNRAFEGHAIRLGGLVAVPMLDEIEALFFLERGLEILGSPQQAGFALLADTPLEHRLHEYRAVTLDQCLDFLLAGVRA